KAASSRRIFDWDGPGNAAPDRPPSPALAMLPARSSPSAPRPSSVSFSSSSPAPSVATERLRIQLVNRSQIRGPLHSLIALNRFVVFSQHFLGITNLSIKSCKLLLQRDIKRLCSDGH